MSNVSDTITRLRSLALNAGSQAEAEAAAAAAERLIAKYQLDEAAISAGTSTVSEPVEVSAVLWSGKSTKVWLGMLAQGLCKEHGCAVVLSRIRGKSATLKLAGTKSDTDLVRYLFAWLSTEIDRLARREHGIAAINAFRVGAVAGVLGAMQEARRIEVAHTARESAQMVLVTRGERALALLTEASGGRLRQGSGPSLHDRGAYERGKSAGSNMTARHGLTAGGGRLALGR